MTDLPQFAAPDPSNGPASADVAADQNVAETPQPQPVTTGQAAALPPPPTNRPPTSWSLAAKSEWPRLPEHVRDAIVQREADASAAFREYAGLKPLIREAEARGKKPEGLLREYALIEDLLRADAESGVRLLLKRMANDRGIPQEQFRPWAASLCADVARAAAENARMH